MKKAVLILLAVIVFAAAIGIFGYKYLASYKNNSSSATPATSPSPKLPNPNDFQWGINTGPNALADFSLNPENWQQQIEVAKKLGVKWVRFAWEYQDGSHVYAREDQVLQALWNNGINVILVLEPTGDWENMDTYQNGYDTALKVSTYYKGKIPFYQILNEGAAMISKTPTAIGQNESDYDPTKYAKIKSYLEGASKGIAEGDSKAKTIVTTVGTHTAYLDMLTRDGIKFDIIGLDWYSWSGDISTKKMEKGGTVADKFKSFGKPLVFTEVNAWPLADPANGGKLTKVDQDLQSTFIQQTADWAYSQKDWVKGFYVFALFDSTAHTNNPNPLNFGIYNTENNASNVSIPSTPRKAFATYQAIIAKYK